MTTSDAVDLTIRPVETDADWRQARVIREAVFVDEQACPPDEEWDGHDATSRHVLGVVSTSKGETAVATARWRAVPHGGAVVAKLERFAVRASHRGRGIGTRLVDAVLDDARRAGFGTFLLHAQAHLEAWYGSFGFESTGRRFDEVGIPHVEMIKRDA